MNWFRLELLEGEDEHIDEVWVTAWEVAMAQEEHPDPANAIFRRPLPKGGWILYFTPAAHLLAETFGATACEPPAPEGLIMVAGEARAWQIHFPGSTAAESRRFEPTHPFPSFDTTFPMQA